MAGPTFTTGPAGLGKRRKDRLAELQLAILNRRILLERFTWRIALTLTGRNSTIDIYDFRQRRLEVGRQFILMEEKEYIS